MLALLLGCTPAPSDHNDTAPSTDSAPPATPSGTLVLCGGGGEGDEGDPAAWSAVAYHRLLDAGDVSGDGRLRVAVVATGEETGWLPDYFEWLGADEAFNVRVSSRAEANAADLATSFADVDAVFLKGGDQGEYYDAWNGTELESQVRALVVDRGGSVGGTSAGAMSLSEYALAGGNDYVSADVLTDSRTDYLGDVSDGGSGVHVDFLGLLPATLVDTHFVVRGRLGRLAGAMALAIEEGAPGGLLGIGIDEQTCVTVSDGVGEVNGVGSVSFLRPGAEPAVRNAGEPLVWPDLALDRLTEGWTWDFAAQAPRLDAPPDGAEALAAAPADAAQPAEAWSVEGRRPADAERFAWVVQGADDADGTRTGTGSPLLLDAIGLLDAHDSDLRGELDESGFRALYAHPEATVFFVGVGGTLTHDADRPELVRIGGDTVAPMSTLVVSATSASWRSLSPSPSPADGGSGTLHAAGLLGLRLHILYDADDTAGGWDMVGDSPAP